MRKIRITLLFCLVAFSSLWGREVFLLEQWKFMLAGLPDSVASPAYDDSHWQSVRVPHDWAIDQPFDMGIDMQLVEVKEDGENVARLRTGRTGALPAFGIGWYRIALPARKSKEDRVSVEFDGAMSLARIYLNGNYIGECPYGYSSFAFDLTEHWNETGDNVLAVRLENKPESSRWYSGAGIYRHVRLVTTKPVHVAHWGTFVRTPEVSTKQGSVHISTTVKNHTGRMQQIRLKTSVISPQGEVLRTANSTQSTTKDHTFDQQLKVSSPALWDIDSPKIHQIVSEVYVDGKLFDKYTTPFGFRTFAFDKDKGFTLNNRSVKLKGVCLHHDLGPLGAVVNQRALERQLIMMKEMGCNAIRTSHNPPSPETLEVCDRLGLLVQVEAFDEWKLGKNANGYHLYFDQWAEKDLQAMIRRDRNHPSVIMWSIGNEVREQDSATGSEVARMLADICRKEDSTRPVTAGFNNHNAAIKNGLADAIDLVGFNYKPHDYTKKHKKHPEYILYGSETASTVSSRGEYKFPVKETPGAYHEDYQTSSYDMEYPNWGSTPDTEFKQQDECDFISGEFVWTGFDYLGEPTPYNSGTPARSSYFGIVDLAGIKKDRYYLYQSQWSQTPVLHLLPHWNWEGRVGREVPVYCYTNHAKAELFVNGQSQGIKKKSEASKYERYRLMWNNVIYTPGEIKVIAYDEAGNKVDSTAIQTAGKSHQIRLTPDRKEITADGKDLSFVLVEILDQKGVLCPQANQLLFFEVKGDGQLKAACNGDPTDQTAFSSPYMRTFNGKLMLVIESTKNTGTAEITVYGGHLKAAQQLIHTHKD